MAKKRPFKKIKNRISIPLGADSGIVSVMGDEVELGQTLLASTDDDDLAHRLTGDGIPFQSGDGVSVLDGSEGKEIVLPFKALSLTSSFPEILIKNAEGVIMALPAPVDGAAYTVVARNGSWQIAAVTPTKCFNTEDICGDCDAEFVAGFVQVTNPDETVSLCLVRLNFADFIRDGISIVGSNTIDVTGNGSPGTPFVISVKVSATEGNLIQVVDDGLLVLATS